MTLNTIIKSPKIKGWLTKQIGYYANGLFLFENEQLVSALPDASQPKIVIVAKCHFSEAWQAFPSVNRKELDKILALKAQTQDKLSTKFQVHNNEKIDGFDVRTITFDDALVSTLGPNKIFIPETDLLVMDDNNALLRVETPLGQLFCANINGIVKSSYAKGIVANLETYKLTVGIPSEVVSYDVVRDNFAQYLLTALYSSPFTKLANVAVYQVKHWFNWMNLHLLYWAPLITVLCFYLLTNGYYYVNTDSIKQSLEQGGNEVSEILQQKRVLDKNNAEISALSTEFEKQNFVHYHWQIVDKLIEAGMTLTRTTYKAPTITIRGTADQASSILAAISEYEYVKTAAFQGAVRKSRGKDSFILTIEVKDK